MDRRLYQSYIAFMKYILAIDQGTSSSRSIIYDHNFKEIASSQKEFKQYYPKAAWVEHELGEIWSGVCQTIKQAIKKANKEDKNFSVSKILSIGITNQRETFGLWNKKTSKPACKAIVWQCKRSAEICKKWKKSKKAQKVAKDSGLVLDPYFSASKLKWLIQNNKKIAAGIKKDKLAFGTIDTFLCWKLSAGKEHVTDTSNASRTLLFDIKKKEWNADALKLVGISKKLLPKVLDSNACFAKTSGLGFLPDGIPVHGVLGDQQAALFGQGCFAAKEAKCTYGTGAFLLVNTGLKKINSKNALSTIAWTIDGKTNYALEGSVFIAGAVIQWLRDGLGIIKNSSEVEKLAASVKDSDGVYFIPALSGLGSPHWVADARGVIGGLSRGSTKAHVARAALDGIAFSVSDLFEDIMKSAKSKVKFLAVDGGACKNDLLMQKQSDLLQCKIIRPKNVESTALGAAMMAALGVGLVKNLSELRSKKKIDKVFTVKQKAKFSTVEKKLWQKRLNSCIK